MTTIGPYTIECELGRGAFGTVLGARTSGGRDVAIKVLTATDAASRARFVRETTLARELGLADGFVPVLDTGTTDAGQPYAVYPLVVGGTLRDRLARPFAVADAVPLVAALARALGKAHERGLVHRDLKPENVLVPLDGTPLVADLGLARGTDESGSRLTETGCLGGTLGYAAPEQLDDLRRAGPASDVFALGAILYELLTGTRPFPATGLLAYAEAVRRAPAPPSAVVASVPSWLDRVCAQALAFDPAERPSDGGALARLLERRHARPRRAGRAALVAGGLALGALAVVAGVAAAVSVEAATPSPPASARRVVVPPCAPVGLGTATRSSGGDDGAIARSLDLEEADDFDAALLVTAKALERTSDPARRIALLRRSLEIAIRGAREDHVALSARALLRHVSDPRERALLERLAVPSTAGPGAFFAWLALEAPRAARPGFVQLARAELLREFGRLDDARVACAAACAVEGSLPRAWRVAGILALEHGDHLAAEAAFARLRALAPCDLEGWKGTLHARARLGRPVEMTLAEIEVALAITRRPAPLLVDFALDLRARLESDAAR